MKRPARPSKDSLLGLPYKLGFRLSIPLLVSLLIRQVLINVGRNPPGGSTADLGLFVLYYAVGLLIIYTPSILFISSLLRDMVKIDSLAKPPGRSEIIMLARGATHNLFEKTAGVLGPTGQLMTKQEVDEFTKMCFRIGAGTYSGVERHPPSEFFTRYPGYLDAHALNLEKNPGSRSARILLATRVALREDYQKDGKAYKDFYEWHNTRPDVELLHVPPPTARRVADELALTTTDMGVWTDQYALLFAPERTGTSVGLTMVPKGGPSFTNCQTYIERLRNSAATVGCPPQLVDPTLAQNWQAYVNPIKRHIQLEPVLLEHLRQCKDEKSSILDAAAGIGCETVLLSDKGFSVVPNELEGSFADVGHVYAHDHGIPLNPFCPHDWLELSRWYPTKFGAVLVLGNSLCLVQSKANRQLAVKQFFDVLQEGGTLIIDERNFSYILHNRELILRNPAEETLHFGGCMYRGTTVKGCPIEISDDKVIWACYTNGKAVTGWETLTKNIIGEFELYPFKEGELEELLTDCQFRIVARYYDLKPTPDEKAEFITYVARKP